ncbi:MAG: peptidase M17, partial [Flavobacterium sp.]
MKTTQIKITARISLFLVMLLGSVQFSLAQTSVPTAKANTSKIWGAVDGIAIEGMVQGPSTEV